MTGKEPSSVSVVTLEKSRLNHPTNCRLCLFFFSLLGSGLPLTQVESIHEIRDDINWLLQDEIVFSLCHVPYISKSILNSVTEHIIKSQDMETSSSYFTPVRLDFVLEQEKSQAIFMEELEKTRICKYVA